MSGEATSRTGPRAAVGRRYNMSGNSGSITSGTGPAESTAREKIIKLSLPNPPAESMLKNSTKPTAYTRLTIDTSNPPASAATGKTYNGESPSKTRPSPRVPPSAGLQDNSPDSEDPQSPRRKTAKRSSSISSSVGSDEDSARKRTKFVIEEITFDAIISDSEPLDMDDIPTDDDLDGLIDEDAIAETEVGRMFGTGTPPDVKVPKRRGRPPKPQSTLATSKSSSGTRKKKNSPTMRQRKLSLEDKELSRYAFSLYIRNLEMLAHTRVSSNVWM